MHPVGPALPRQPGERKWPHPLVKKSACACSVSIGRQPAKLTLRRLSPYNPATFGIYPVFRPNQPLSRLHAISHDADLKELFGTVMNYGDLT
jgi:hypothetical protein